MKKIILTSISVLALSISVFAQGSFNYTDSNINPGVSTNGATSPSTTAWYNGTLALQLWYAPGTNASISAINALDGTTSAAAAYTLLVTAGFTDLTNVVTTSSTGVFSYGSLTLPSVPTGTLNTFALVGIEGSNFGSPTAGSYAGVIAFVNNDGGNLSATPIPGTPSNLSGWNTLNQNLALTLQAVPEPSTMALAGLGGLATLLFRRKK